MDRSCKSLDSNYKGGFGKKWVILDDDPRVPFLNATGFGWVRKLQPFKVDNALLCCLYSRFDPIKHVFQFGDEKWMITLEDLVCFTGMNVGKKQIQLDITNSGIELCSTYLGEVSDKKFMNRGAVKFTWLIDNFEKVGKRGIEEEDEDLKKSVRAYLLYVIGSVIFPTSDSAVSVLYLQYLGDLEAVQSYGWLLAMLAFVVKHFAAKPSSSGVKYLPGCAPIIMLWGYEHFHKLAPGHLNEMHFSEDRNIPLMVYWSQQLTSKAARKMTMADFEVLVDELEYTPISVQYPPDRPDLKEDLRYSMIRGDIFYGTDFYYYDPFNCPQQFNMPCSSSTPEVPSRFKLRKYFRTGPKHEWADTAVKRLEVVEDDWIIGDIVATSSHASDIPTSSHSPVQRMGTLDDSLVNSEDDSLVNHEDASIRCIYWYPAGRCRYEKRTGSLFCQKHVSEEDYEAGQGRNHDNARGRRIWRGHHPWGIWIYDKNIEKVFACNHHGICRF